MVNNLSGGKKLGTWNSFCIEYTSRKKGEWQRMIRNNVNLEIQKKKQKQKQKQKQK